MKTLLICIVSSFTLSSHVNYDVLLNSFGNHSFFVVIKVKSSQYNGLIAIENGDLYRYCDTDQNLSIEQYKTLMKEKLGKNKALRVELDTLKKDFERIKTFKTIDENAKKGMSEFIKIYFVDGKALKGGFSDAERAAIIEKLFNWGILSIIDCEYGSLYICRE